LKDLTATLSSSDKVLVSAELDFTTFFAQATGLPKPYDWQSLVAREGFPDCLSVPTGLGKTEIALAWAWRLLLNPSNEPRHLVYCLPQRTLVSQTITRLKGYFSNSRKPSECLNPGLTATGVAKP
jgi:reverse gyrase